MPIYPTHHRAKYQEVKVLCERYLLYFSRIGGASPSESFW